MKALEALKDTWDEYSSLIMALAGLFIFISGSVGTISGIVIQNMVRNTIKQEVGQVQAVTDLALSVSTLNATVKANTASANRLTDATKTLQADVTAIHKHLAGID